MRRLLVGLCMSAVALAILADSGPALAADDTWVSANGTNAGGCTISAPCRSLQYALVQTSPGGTITVLSSGRYGPVRINKSVHIVAEGVEAVVTGVATCDAAVCVDVGTDDVVSLRGLTILVTEQHKSGIVFSGGGGLHLDQCKINGFPTFGIQFEPNAAAHLHVFDSKLTGAGMAAAIFAPNATLRALFDRTEIHDGNQALQFGAAGTGSIQATIRDSLMAGHWGHGILLASLSAAPVNVMLDRSVVANAQVGLEVSSPGGTLRVGDSVVSGHPTMPQSYSGVLSYGTNKIVEGIDGFQHYQKIPMK